MIGRGETIVLRDSPTPRIAVSTTNSTWTALGLNLILHNKKLALVNLGCGMAPYAP
jgi:hypothetical protein